MLSLWKEILLRLTSITNLLERLSNLVLKLSMCAAATEEEIAHGHAHGPGGHNH